MKPASERSFYFTGSGVNYALSLYGTAKINEVLGAEAEAVFPEQLGHAKLFTINKKRDVIVCMSSGQDKAAVVHEILRTNGFRSLLQTASGISVTNRSLQTAIDLQQLVLSLAKKRGITECAFLSNKGRLDLSNEMIY